MNYFRSIICLILFSLLINACAQTETKMSTENIYNIAINDINGDSINLNDYKNKFILFVNVASKCGFTPQYKELQELHTQYKDQLVIIGVPCNQFGEQEPGNAEQIKSFCSKNYGVEFLITEKIEVKGDNQHLLYQWLTSKEKNRLKNSSVKWNFQKYLIDKEGQLIDFYYSTTSPLSDKIIDHIK